MTRHEQMSLGYFAHSPRGADDVCRRPGGAPFQQALRLGLLLAGAVLASAAQAFPDKPITFIVPFAAGSATDQFARAVGKAITDETHQPVVVENKAGASGMMAAQAAARAPADGYTLFFTTNTSQAANEHLYKKLPYDPVKDFAPITALGTGGQVLVVNAASPIQSVADLIARARREPGKLSFGSGSSSSRVGSELLQQMSGVQMLHVPYKSTPLAITDLLGGQIDLLVADLATGVPQVRAGKLRALGVTTSKRVSLLPEVPTIAEAGVPGYEVTFWFAAYAPAGTPAAIVLRLNSLLVGATRSAEVKRYIESTGSEVFTTTPEGLAKFQASQTQAWGRIIKAAGIEPE